MSFFFERNAELYVSNVTSGWTSGNTDKIPLKAGFSFNSEEVLSRLSRNTIKETESRAVKQYSSKESLVSFNFSTYINPVQLASVSSIDRYLWQALGTYTPGATYSQASFTSTNVASATEITLWVRFPNTTYRLNQCVITSAEVVGSINDLAHIVWTGKARSIDNLGSVTVPHTSLTVQDYIINKLSTINLTIGATTYDIPITNYSINIKNDVFYVYRQKIGQVSEITNQYTGDRTIDGDFNAYLKIGVNKSGNLLDDLRSFATDLENNTANFTIYTGNLNNTHAEFIMPNTILDIPRQQFTDLVTLRVPYSALESTKSAADELTVRYYI